MTEATLVKNVLTDNGIPCWMAPDSIPIGSSYASEIKVAIENCTVFVLVLSEKAQNSAYVEKELDSAITGHKIVYPFMIENCKLNDAFDFYLSNVQRHNAFESKSAAMEKMVKEIKALFGATDDNPVNFNAIADASRQEKKKDPTSMTEQPTQSDGEQKNTAEGLGKFKSFLYRLTPFANKGMQEKNAKFALIVTTVFWAIIALTMSTWIGDVDYYNVISPVVELLFVVLVALGTWHITGFISKWISRLPIKNKFFHHLFVFVFCAFVATMLTGIIFGVSFSFLESIADELYFSRLSGY